MDVLVYDQNFERVGPPIDQFKSFIWTDRYYGAGDFELYLPSSSSSLAGVAVDCWLTIPGEDRYMIIEKMHYLDSEEDGHYVKITGRSLEYLLARRIIWEAMTLNGSFQSGILQMVNGSCISYPGASRNFGFLSSTTSPNPIFTPMTLVDQFYGENLYEEIVRMCIDRGVSYKIRMPTLGSMQFQLYAGADRSYDQTVNDPVVFSPNFDNLASSEYISDTTDYFNSCLVIGEGPGTTGVRAEVRSAGYEDGLLRRETYCDASGVSKTFNGATLSDANYVLTIKEKAAKQLAEHRHYLFFDGEAADTSLYKYNQDFFLGDIVQLEDEYGSFGKSRIIEYIRSYTEDEEKEYPTFSAI